MIAIAVTVVLVILVLANVGLKLFNYLYPPCENSYEYFEAARMMPDGAAASLGSIPTSTELNYVGVKTVATDQPGVIGITSHVPSDRPHPKPTENKRLFDAVNVMFPDSSSGKQRDGAELTRSISGYDGARKAMFKNEMEGLKANSSHHSTDRRTMKPSGFVRRVDRDGYRDR